MRAGETLIANPALNGRWTSKAPRTSLNPSVMSLKSIPTPMPWNTGAAWRPLACEATSTSAHAIPSG